MVPRFEEACAAMADGPSSVVRDTESGRLQVGFAVCIASAALSARGTQVMYEDEGQEGFLIEVSSVSRCHLSVLVYYLADD